MSKKTFLPEITENKKLANLSQVIDWGLDQANVPETWKTTQGEGITILVIDTGFPTHDDIGDNALKGKNCVPTEPLEDENGHQSHCVGIICAKNNSHGMVGVAPKAKALCVKALSKFGSGTYAQLEEALQYAIDIKPDIVSMSLGGNSYDADMHEKIKQLYKMNIPVICAAGNTGRGGVNWPAAYPQTIAVAAHDKHGKIARFSSRGERVEWAAPGVDIYSTYLNNGYRSLNGTSMACPFIAGVVALMLAKHKKQESETGKNDCKTVAQMREHLLKYTLDKGMQGKDSSWGYGVIDVEGLISGKKPKPKPEPKPEPEPDIPHPYPEREPDSEDAIHAELWRKILMGVGLLITAGLSMLGVSQCNKEEPVDWDKRFEEEMERKNKNGTNP